MIPTRAVIWLLVFSYTIVSMFYATAINIAILSMVKNRHSTSNSSLTSNIVCSNVTSLFISSEDKVPSASFVPENNILEWTEMEENAVLNAGYWFAGYAPFIGGLLCHRYGAKKVIGIFIFITGILSSLTPPLAYMGSFYVVWLRAIQGFFGGLPMAAVFSVMGKWCPPDERGKFMSIYLGVPLGEALCYIMSGFIAERYGWMYVFHAVSVITVLWSIVWLLLMYDSPKQHPRISNKEKNFILSTLGHDVTTTKLPIPWGDIFLCGSFWICVLCNFGCICIYITLSVYGPLYFKNVFGFATEKNGVVSGFPYIVKAVVTYVVGIFTDLLLKKKFVSLSKVRKSCALLGSIFCGLAICGVMYAKCNVNFAVSAISISIILSAFYTVGPSVTIIDMSPNFCEILQGISCTIAFFSSYLCALSSNYFSLHYDQMTRWSYTFVLAGLTNIISGILFIAFCNCKVQKWNSPTYKPPKRRCWLFNIRKEANYLSVSDREPIN